MRLGSDVITRSRAGADSGEDDYGNPIPGAADELDIDGCSVQPGGGSEIQDRREATTTLFTVWAPPADVVETDTVIYAGTAYAVDGAIERWQLGTRLEHLVIRLKAVSG